MNSKTEGSGARMRIGKWFRRLNAKRLNREVEIRLEERRRERARIGRELHDTLFQGFIGASLQLWEAVSQVPDDWPNKPSLTSALSLLQRVIDEGRDTLHGLRLSGVVSINLEEAFSAVCEQFVYNPRIRFRVFVKGSSARLEPATQEQIYMIGREALVNAFRHSQATSVETEVEYSPSGLRVIVRDNGCGIDGAVIRSGRAKHWGFTGMRERAENIGGQLQVWSRPGAGTEVEIYVPLSIAAEVCLGTSAACR